MTEDDNKTQEKITFLLRLRWLFLFIMTAMLLWVGMLGHNFEQFSTASTLTDEDLYTNVRGLRKGLGSAQRSLQVSHRKHRDTDKILIGLSDNIAQAAATYSLSLQQLRESHGRQLHDLYTEYGELHGKLSKSNERHEAALDAAVSNLELRLILNEASLLEQQEILVEYKANFEQIMLVLSSFHRTSKTDGLEKPPQQPHAFCDSSDTVCGTWSAEKGE